MVLVRRIMSVIATVMVAAVVINAPAAAAPVDVDSATQVQATCSVGTVDGTVRVYADYNCNTLICATGSWDSDYGNSSGPCQGSDTNRATSVLNRGYSGSLEDVQFFNGTGTDWGGGWFCLQNRSYVVDLNGVWFSSGINANNQISSHRWRDAC